MADLPLVGPVCRDLDCSEAVVSEFVWPAGADWTRDHLERVGQQRLAVGFARIPQVLQLRDTRLVVVGRQEHDMADAVVGNEFQQTIALRPVSAPPGFAVLHRGAADLIDRR